MELADNAEKLFNNYGVAKCIIRNPRIAKFEDIMIPADILVSYNVSLVKFPIVRKQDDRDVVTFIDDLTLNAPIILPRWCVMKYCLSKFGHESVILMNIPDIDDKIALIVMKLFENSEGPTDISDLELKKILEINTFLTGI